MAEPTTTPAGDAGNSGDGAAQAAAAQGADKGAEATKETYTAAEVKAMMEQHATALETERKRYGGLDVKLTETTKQLNELLSKDESAKWDKFVKDVEAKGGDAGLAKGLLQLREELTKREVSLKQTATEVEQFMRVKSANALIKELGLENTDGKVETTLAGIDKPEAMRVKAMELLVEQLKVKANKPTTTDQGKPGGAQPNSDRPTHERLGRAWEEAMANIRK